MPAVFFRSIKTLNSSDSEDCRGCSMSCALRICCRQHQRWWIGTKQMCSDAEVIMKFSSLMIMRLAPTQSWLADWQWCLVCSSSVCWDPLLDEVRCDRCTAPERCFRDQSSQTFNVLPDLIRCGAADLGWEKPWRLPERLCAIVILKSWDQRLCSV